MFWLPISLTICTEVGGPKAAETGTPHVCSVCRWLGKGRYMKITVCSLRCLSLSPPGLSSVVASEWLDILCGSSGIWGRMAQDTETGGARLTHPNLAPLPSPTCRGSHRLTHAQGGGGHKFHILIVQWKGSKRVYETEIVLEFLFWGAILVLFCFVN